jgi:hypothetical protein
VSRRSSDECHQPEKLIVLPARCATTVHAVLAFPRGVESLGMNDEITRVVGRAFLWPWLQTEMV